MAQIQLSGAIFLAICGLAVSQFQQNHFGAQPQFGQQQYQQAPQQQQFQQQRSSSCPDVNGTYPVSGQCDAYIECKNGVAEEKLCPDGLLFNDKLGPHHFPCQYPIDVTCDNRAKLQSPQATDECPHQFGYFKMGDRVNCGQFMNCVHGRGFMFDCPEGLAFSQETYRCEWPDQVADCDAEAFVGFTCPPETRSDTVVDFTFYRHGGDCQVYYICIEGRPRMYRCGEGKLFNDLTNQCDSAENVTTCGGAGFRAAAPKPVAIQQHQTRVAPVSAQQPQYYQAQPTQKPVQPFQFNQFSATTAQPRAQFGAFSSFQHQQPSAQQSSFQRGSIQKQPSQQSYQFSAQPKSLNTFAAPAIVPQAPVQPVIEVEQQQEPNAFNPRIGSEQEANIQQEAPAVAVQPQAQFNQFGGFNQFASQPAVRTTQPESPLPQTRSQINTYGQFNSKSTSRGSKRYDQGSHF